MSTFDNPNMWCSYLIAGLGFLLASRTLDWITRRWFNLLLGIILCASVVTLSPGLGGIGLLLGLWAWRRLHTNHRTLAAFGCIGGAAAAFIMLIALLINPAHPFSAASVRWEIWSAAVETWRQHPWFGVGTGQGVVAIGFVVPSGETDWITDAHNVALNIAGQAGIVGVLALAGLVASVWRNAIACRCLGFPRDTLREACLFAFIAAFVYQGLSSSLEDARHLWILIGCVAAFSVRSEDSRQPVAASIR